MYVVSKGKLSSIRPSEYEGTGEKILSDISSSSYGCSSQLGSGSLHCSMEGRLYKKELIINDIFSFSSSEQADQSSTASSSSSSSLFHSISLPQQRLQALSTINQALLHRKMNLNESIFSRSLSPETGERDDDDDDNNTSCSYAIDDCTASSFRSLTEEEQSWTNDQASSSDFSSAASQVYAIIFLFNLFSVLSNS